MTRGGAHDEGRRAHDECRAGRTAARLGGRGRYTLPLASCTSCRRCTRVSPAGSLSPLPAPLVAAALLHCLRAALLRPPNRCTLRCPHAPACPALPRPAHLCSLLATILSNTSCRLALGLGGNGTGRERTRGRAADARARHRNAAAQRRAPFAAASKQTLLRTSWPHRLPPPPTQPPPMASHPPARDERLPHLVAGVALAPPHAAVGRKLVGLCVLGGREGVRGRRRVWEGCGRTASCGGREVGGSGGGPDQRSAALCSYHSRAAHWMLQLLSADSLAPLAPPTSMRLSSSAALELLGLLPLLGMA